MYININGKFYKKEKAKISVLDRGFLYGDGIFETMRVYNGHIFALSEHLERLRNSAETILLAIPKKNEEIEKELTKTLEKNRLRNAILRISFSRGIGPFGLNILHCNTPTFVIMCRKFQPYPEEFYMKGVSIIISKKIRRYSSSLAAKIKSANFLENIVAKSGIDGRGNGQEAGPFEVLFLNEKGYVTEGTVSNFFVVKKNILITAPLKAGILSGITRGIVLKLAKESGIKVKEMLFKPDLIYKADEAFLTNTSIEILPVGEVNGKIIGHGKPGEVILRLSEKFCSYRA